MSCVTYHLESLLRDEARALAGQGMVPSAGRPASTHTALPPVGAVRQPGAGRSSSRVPSQVVPYSIDPAFFEAWRESQGQPVDVALTAQLAMGIR